MPAVLRHHIEQFAAQPGEIDFFKFRDYDVVNESMHALIFDDIEAIPSGAHQVVTKPNRRFLFAQPGCKTRRGVECANTREYGVGSQEVAGDERSEIIGDAILAARDDCGMRNRNAHRVLEQCNDRKPVGHSAYHRCFAERCTNTECRMPRLEEPREQIACRYQDQETRCKKFHTLKRRAPVGSRLCHCVLPVVYAGHWSCKPAVLRLSVFASDLLRQSDIWTTAQLCM